MTTGKVIMGCGVLLAMGVRVPIPGRARAEEIAVRTMGDRFLTLVDFPDGGLTAGVRDVHIVLPPGYQKGRQSYPVLYFNDGETIFGLPNQSRGAQADADYWHDQLLAEGLIRPAILVAVANAKGATNARGRDLVPRWTPESEGRAEQYFSFLATRLKPYIDGHFRTQSDPRNTGIMGYSLGGLAAFYFGYEHPEVFGMAGCMSPSLWSGQSRLLHDVATDGRPRHTTRFWIDGGDKDVADIEVIAPRMTRILIDKGWKEGEDVAFQLGYGHSHSRTAQRERLRDALYFLLRRSAPRLHGLALKPLADPSAAELDLQTAGERALVWPELLYDHGFHLNSVATPLRIDDPTVATLDSTEAGRIRAVGQGSTMLRAEHAGLKAQLPITGYVPAAYVRAPLPRTRKPTTVDGILGEWTDLPFTVAAGDKPSASARFAVRYDDQFVFVAVSVRDTRLVIQPGVPPAEQDGIEVWIDARADPRRSESKAEADGFQTTFLLVPVTPTLAPSATIETGGPPRGRPGLPGDLRRACRVTAEGYAVEIAIPVAYLNQTQGGPWHEFRMNLHLRDFRSAGAPKTDLWWQPPWRSSLSTAGSGTFARSQ